MQDVPIKLLPGVPVRAALLGAGPFLSATDPVSEEQHTCALEGGAPLPPFSVRAYDKHGNVCIPSPALTWNVSTQSPAISPNPAVAAPDMSGVATLLNARIARNVTKDADWTVPVSISVAAAPAQGAEGLEEILGSAGAAQNEGKLEGLRLLLAPSTGPHSLGIFVGDDEVPFTDDPETGKRIFNVRPPFSFGVCLWDTVP